MLNITSWWISQNLWSFLWVQGTGSFSNAMLQLITFSYILHHGPFAGPAGGKYLCISNRRTDLAPDRKSATL